jgi:nucleotide-binding universal stress UspA family protein
MKPQAFLPLITYPEATLDSVATNATSMAAYLGAELHATAFDLDMPPRRDVWLRMLYVELPELIREAEKVSRERGKHLLELVREQAVERGVNLTASTAEQPLLGEVIAEHARYFDISLLGWEAGNSTSRATAQAIMFGSGRPVVMLPAAAEIGLVRHVAIAWDGSRVAARAVADAMPFLQRASRTSVLTVVDEKPLKDKDVAQRLASSLGKRGIAADAVSFTVADRPIGIGLQEQAIEGGVDLLVMGAFGHSVIRDFVLGCATEDVLDDLRLPVLFSH